MSLPLALPLVGVSWRRSAPIEPGNDPNFSIVAHQDAGLRKYNRKRWSLAWMCMRWPRWRTPNWHAANVLAQYLDNDEDGEVDDPNVLEKLHENKAYLVPEPRRDLLGSEAAAWAKTWGDETAPDYVSRGKTGRFDASLEEVLHLVHYAGLFQAYPQVFGQVEGSELARAMDRARGGHFERIPKEYPQDAWYTYTDKPATTPPANHRIPLLAPHFDDRCARTASRKSVTNGGSTPEVK